MIYVNVLARLLRLRVPREPASDLPAQRTARIGGDDGHPSALGSGAMVPQRLCPVPHRWQNRHISMALP